MRYRSSDEALAAPWSLERLQPFLAPSRIDIVVENDDSEPKDEQNKKNSNNLDLYEWLKQGDAVAAALRAEQEECGTDALTNLFRNDSDEDDDEEDDQDGKDDRSIRSDADYEGFTGRVRVWTSSTTCVDGYGSILQQQDEQTNRHDNGKQQQEGKNETTVQVIYVISESWKGYGDMLWASARYLANQFANPVACRALLQYDDADVDNHPLHGKTVLELGAGCGVPSLTAFHCGAECVVVSDLRDPNRIRCLAEALARNHDTTVDCNSTGKKSKAFACPHDWGEDTTPLLSCLQDLSSESNNKNNDHSKQSRRGFDVVCATDCLFMPWLHQALCRSMYDCLDKNNPNAVAVVTFCIHAAFSKADAVWPFLDVARATGFNTVEVVLPPVQCSPPRQGMDLEQGLVNIIRLRR